MVFGLYALARGVAKCDDSQVSDTRIAGGRVVTLRGDVGMRQMHIEWIFYDLSLLVSCVGSCVPSSTGVCGVVLVERCEVLLLCFPSQGCPPNNIEGTVHRSTPSTIDSTWLLCQCSRIFRTNNFTSTFTRERCLRWRKYVQHTNVVQRIY